MSQEKTTQATTEKKDYPTLEVTKVTLYPFKDGPSLGKTKSLASVVLNEQLQLNCLKIIEGANGLFVAYPNDPSCNGEDYRSVFYSITRQLREHIEEIVLAKYNLLQEK